MKPALPNKQAVRHAAWAVWNNPIFRRYCQSRLRVRGVGLGLLITGLVAGFIMAMATSIGVRSRMDPADAARSAIIPLLVVQSLILFVLGTAQVAGGMAARG